MSKLAQIKIFNNLLNQFFSFLEIEFPFFKSDIILTKSFVDLLRKANPRSVVEQFMIYVSPYKDQINNCDEHFFLNLDLETQELDKENILLGLKIKKMWDTKDTTIQQKAAIWIYLQKLLKIGLNII